MRRIALALPAALALLGLSACSFVLSYGGIDDGVRDSGTTGDDDATG